ncbi:MAG: hypothetical protein JW395_3538 [Nitrospira sp.]|nr:hypothetical protein [Nitrospira sp.]
MLLLLKEFVAVDRGDRNFRRLNDHANDHPNGAWSRRRGGRRKLRLAARTCAYDKKVLERNIVSSAEAARGRSFVAVPATL